MGNGDLLMIFNFGGYWLFVLGQGMVFYIKDVGIQQNLVYVFFFLFIFG